MPESILKDKSKEFAKNIVFLCRKLKCAGIEQILLNQLLKSGTSIGANIHEAQYAQGSKDFISKLEIALKEANESEYWLGLLFDTESIEKSIYEKLLKDETEIRRMLVSSITTIKSREET